MIPQPSKRPWGHPLPPAAIAYLVHPNPRSRLHLPFSDAHGNVVTWNGGLAVRIRTGMPSDLKRSEVPFEVVDNTIPWPDRDLVNDTDWRCLDDDSGLIWRYPPKSPYIECRGGEFEPNKLTSARVGASTVVPAALLQLCARLPRCYVKIRNQGDGGLVFVWKGGEAWIKPMADLPDPSFGILTPRRQHGAGAGF